MSTWIDEGALMEEADQHLIASDMLQGVLGLAPADVTLPLMGFLDAERSAIAVQGNIRLLE
ncbi:hypothetical protein [Rhizobium sp. B21/90]|uniref:hypothetical protein n=1 Tax=Rhizobium sp. B21/90 TaxID=2819993 RepID=UPI001C5B00B6|nr:hypothetical protein [Rhizobium sp. B21/90]QYA03923.1 hypothetical protein J5278_24415 [Rhizobium sp. B21/90]